MLKNILDYLVLSPPLLFKILMCRKCISGRCNWFFYAPVRILHCTAFWFSAQYFETKLRETQTGPRFNNPQFIMLRAQPFSFVIKKRLYFLVSCENSLPESQSLMNHRCKHQRRCHCLLPFFEVSYLFFPILAGRKMKFSAQCPESLELKWFGSQCWMGQELQRSFNLVLLHFSIWWIRKMENCAAHLGTFQVSCQI